MGETQAREGTIEAAPHRVPLMLRVSHWEMLTVCIMLLGVFALRQTGNLPGHTIRLLDILLVAATLAVAMYAAKVGRRTWIVNGTMAVASVVTAIVGVATSSVTIQRIAGGISAYVVAASLVFILLVVLRQQHVTGDTLFGAFAAYLAAAVIFAIVYTVIARADPGAFEPPQPVIDGQTDLYYFSFVTVTSLGYGDISPASDLTRVLAPIEAVIGAILIAGLVGRIVGLLVAQTTSGATERQLDALTRAVERLDPDRLDPDRPDPDTERVSDSVPGGPE